MIWWLAASAYTRHRPAYDRKHHADVFAMGLPVFLTGLTRCLCLTTVYTGDDVASSIGALTWRLRVWVLGQPLHTVPVFRRPRVVPLPSQTQGREFEPRISRRKVLTPARLLEPFSCELLFYDSQQSSQRQARTPEPEPEPSSERVPVLEIGLHGPPRTHRRRHGERTGPWTLGHECAPRHGLHLPGPPSLLSPLPPVRIPETPSTCAVQRQSCLLCLSANSDLSFGEGGVSICRSFGHDVQKKRRRNRRPSSLRKRRKNKSTTF